MVTKVITDLDLSKASGPDYILVVVLENCEPKLSYITAELFHMCLKGSCFLDCWKVSFVLSVFKNAVERSTAKNYYPTILLSVINKVFENYVNNWLIDQLENSGPFIQQQIFCQYYLIELLGLLIGAGLLKL